DYSFIPDANNYLEMGKGNLNVHPTHRYRIIIPGLAALLSEPINLVYEAIWPHRQEGDWALKLGFYLVNTFVFSLSAWLIYATCRAYGASTISSLIAVAAVITSRWVQVIAALPMTDSLYMLVIVATLLGIKARIPWLLAAAIFLGLFAKESFVFFLPAIVYFGRDVLPLKKQIPLIILSGALVFALRRFIDMHIGLTTDAGISNALEHIENIRHTIVRLASFRGIGELLSVFGIFSAILIAGFFGGKKERASWYAPLDISFPVFTGIIIIHMFLSSEAGRMLFFASPLFAVAVAVILDKHRYFKTYRAMISKNAI
ncbi:MAG: hypothetical protein ACK4ND_20265, partial [Cytophagaceae bacterium]